MQHPYIGLPAIANSWEGVIVHVGGEDSVTVMLPDGTHKTTRFYNVKVDPAKAEARMKAAQ